MKKFLVLILSLTYLATTTGATVYLHYCMGNLIEQNLLLNDSEKHCSNCGMDKAEGEKGCCKHEQKQLKVDNPHNVQDLTLKSMQLSVVALPASFVEIPAIGFTSVTEENPTGNAPPRNGNIAIYIRNCVFRI